MESISKPDMVLLFLGSNRTHQFPVSIFFISERRIKASPPPPNSDFNDDCFAHYLISMKIFGGGSRGEEGSINICYAGWPTQGLSVHVESIRVSWKYLTLKLRTTVDLICFSPSNYLASNKDSICSRIQVLLKWMLNKAKICFWFYLKFIVF